MKKNSFKTYNFSLHCANGLLYENFGIYTVINGSLRGHMIVRFATTCTISDYHY